MKKTITLLALFAIQVLLNNLSAQTTYSWIGQQNGYLGESTNWSPTRTSPSSTDILLFNRAQLDTIIITNGSGDADKCGRLVLTNNTNVVLKNTFYSLSILGNSQNLPVIDIPSGCTLTDLGIYSNALFLSSLANNKTINISGSLNIIPNQNDYYLGNFTSTTIINGNLNIYSLGYFNFNGYVNVNGNINKYGVGEIIFSANCTFNLNNNATCTFNDINNSISFAVYGFNWTATNPINLLSGSKIIVNSNKPSYFLTIPSDSIYSNIYLNSDSVNHFHLSVGKGYSTNTPYVFGKLYINSGSSNFAPLQSNLWAQLADNGYSGNIAFMDSVIIEAPVRILLPNKTYFNGNLKINKGRIWGDSIFLRKNLIFGPQGNFNNDTNIYSSRYIFDGVVPQKIIKSDTLFATGSTSFLFKNSSGVELGNILKFTSKAINESSGFGAIFSNSFLTGTGKIIWGPQPNFQILTIENTNNFNLDNHYYSNTSSPEFLKINVSGVANFHSTITTTTLNLLSGKMQFNTNDTLIFKPFGDGYIPAITGNLNYSFYIIGKIKVSPWNWFSSSNGIFDFPLGTSTKYKGVKIIGNPTNNTPGSLLLEFISGVTNSYGMPLIDGTNILKQVSREGFWRVKALDGLTFDNNVQFTFTTKPDSGMGNISEMAIVRRENSSSPWGLVGSGYVLANYNDSLLIDATRGLASTDLGEFALASSQCINSPATPTINGTTNYSACLNTNLSFSALPVSGASIFWRGPNGFTSTSNSINLTNITNSKAGTYYAYSVIGATACDTSSAIAVNVSIATPPFVESLIVNGSLNLCSGDSVILNIPSQSGYKYRWLKNANNTSNNGDTLNTLVVKTSGTYTVKVTNSNGCFANMRDTIVTVNPKPNTFVINGNNNVLNGSTETYSVTNSVGSIYNWTVTNGTVNSGNGTNSISVTWPSTNGSGNVKVIETNNNGCKGDFINLPIIISNNPDNLSVSTQTVNSLKSGDNTNITVTSNRNWTVSSNQTWATINPNSGSGNGAFSISTTPNPNNARTAIISVTAGTIIKNITVNQDGALGINEQAKANKIEIYPNPTSDKITIISNQLISIVDLFDVTGKLVFSQNKIKQSNMILDLSALNNGVYFINTQTENGGISNSKIVISK